MRSLRVLLTLFSLALVVSHAHATEFKPGDKVELKAGDGLLAIDIDATGLVSSAKLERMGSLLGGETLMNLGTGNNVRLIALPAGDYRWSRLTVAQGGWYVRLRDIEQFHVKIEPGVVNYAGDFIVYPSGYGAAYTTHIVNRAARMMVNLDHEFPGVRRKFSLRYQGAFPDSFPDFADKILGEQSAFDAVTAGSANAVKDAPKDTPAELRPLVTELFAHPQVESVELNPRGDLIAMIEYRQGKHRVSVLDVTSMLARDVYRGDVGVDSIQFAGDRTLLFDLDQTDAGSNHVVHIQTHAGAAPEVAEYAIPDRGWFVSAGSGRESRVTYAHRDSEGTVHLFNIDLAGKRFDTSQFRTEYRLDKGLDKAFNYLTDANDNLRVAFTLADGDYAMMYRADAASPWKEVSRYSADDVFRPVLLSADGNSLVALSNKGRAQTDLVRIRLPEGTVAETVFSTPGSDVTSALVREVDRNVIGVTVYRDGARDTEYLDESNASLRHSFQRVLPGKSIAIYDASTDRSRMLVLAYDEIDRGTFYFFDAGANRLQELLPIVPAMEHVHAARSRLLKVVARDATPIEAYLTLPSAAKPPYPLIVMPHGGPIGIRDSLRFDPEVQLLANRGYAVLRANYRGSGGFGRAFLKAGFGGWGKDIEDDVLAAVDAAEKAAPIDHQRIALEGGSYGGYSTLMGLIRTPQRFRCGVAMYAVTDIPLMFTSSDWAESEQSRKHMMEVVGDPTKALAEMEAVSPDYQYAKLDRPLLIVHGAQDRRVPLEHALRLLILLGHAKKVPESLILAKEGHGIYDNDARYLAEAAIDRFLSACLAPAAQPAP